MQVSVIGGSGRSGFGDGQGAQTHFFHAQGVAVDGDGTSSSQIGSTIASARSARTATSAHLRGAEARTLVTGKVCRPTLAVQLALQWTGTGT
jgi:hypothetical protein